MHPNIKPNLMAYTQKFRPDTTKHQQKIWKQTENNTTGIQRLLETEQIKPSEWMMLYKEKCPTILHAAAINKHSDVLESFLKKGVFVDACDN